MQCITCQQIFQIKKTNMMSFRTIKNPGKLNTVLIF